ncbi:MAG: CCA tRNA nucleotidyltransferase [Alphaproteobacteria bacterium]
MTEAKAHKACVGVSLAGMPWFDAQDVRAVFRALEHNEHEARIVGGAVRNALLGEAIADIDFATTATPEEVMRFATEAGLKAVGTGLKHGTVTLVVNGRPFEVTTLRLDVETFGRHATVAYTRDWAEDAKRRDFTMNALYADAEGRIFDPLGEGVGDLRGRRVRFIGVARDRIREDYLRILRFFRFTAGYAEGAPDRQGFHAAVVERGGIATLSAERIQAELWRILKGRTPLRALEPMAEGGFLTAVLGGVARLSHCARLMNIETTLGLSPDATRRLAALAVMVEEDAARLVERLRLSNADAARLAAMATLSPRITRDMSEAQARQALYRLGAENWRDRVLIAWARSGDAVAGAETGAGKGAIADMWCALATLPDRWTPPEFPLKGADLLAAGMAKGPRVGEALRTAEAHWIASGFSLNQEELLKAVQ